MAYVYQHKRKDSGTVFYISIGENDDDNFKRAYSKNDRNKYWRNITNKVDWEVEILYEDLGWEEASNMEMQLILDYGRVDLGTGILCNMTDGGDGGKRMVFTKEMRLKQRKAKQCKIIYGLSSLGKIRRFDSINSAAQLLSITKPAILACLRRKHNYAKGWKFSYTKVFSKTGPKRCNNTSGYEGVSKINNGWRAITMINGKIYRSVKRKTVKEALMDRNKLLTKHKMFHKIQKYGNTNG